MLNSKQDKRKQPTTSQQYHRHSEQERKNKKNASERDEKLSSRKHYFFPPVSSAWRAISLHFCLESQEVWQKAARKRVKCVLHSEYYFFRYIIFFVRKLADTLTKTEFTNKSACVTCVFFSSYISHPMQFQIGEILPIRFWIPTISNRRPFFFLLCFGNRSPAHTDRIYPESAAHTEHTRFPLLCVLFFLFISFICVSNLRAYTQGNFARRNNQTSGTGDSLWIDDREKTRHFFLNTQIKSQLWRKE